MGSKQVDNVCFPVCATEANIPLHSLYQQRNIHKVAKTKLARAQTHKQTNKQM